MPPQIFNITKKVVIVVLYGSEIWLSYRGILAHVVNFFLNDFTKLEKVDLPRNFEILIRVTKFFLMGLDDPRITK